MRSLGVIFLSDVVGYSKMMTDDETGTLNLIREFQKEIIKPTLAKYHGNMIKSLGDGWLVEFKSASNALHIRKNAAAKIENADQANNFRF